MWTVSSDVKDQLKISDDHSIQKLLRRALKFFNRVGRPTLIGPLSLDMGISLRQLQVLISVLIESGDIRPASIDELRLMGIDQRDGAIVYALTHPPVANLAFD